LGTRRAIARVTQADRLSQAQHTSAVARAANNKNKNPKGEDNVASKTLEDYDDGSAVLIDACRTASSGRRILVAGSVGTAIEWYDFFIYGLIAPQ
jgi:hypothetical protein